MEKNEQQVDAIAQADAYANNAGLPLYSKLLADMEYEKERKLRDEERNRSAREQAGREMDYIAEMVKTIQCDYERLEELADDLESTWSDSETTDNFADWVKSQSENDDSEHAADCREYLAIKTEAGECESRDDAQTIIAESPISVEIQSGWCTGRSDFEPEYFRILLCTGGPAVQIVGELDEDNYPKRARIEYQDWGTPWTEYYGENVDDDILLTYCREFYFGE